MLAMGNHTHGYAEAMPTKDSLTFCPADCPKAAVHQTNTGPKKIGTRPKLSELKSECDWPFQKSLNQYG
ncbi:hypothetical protein KNHN1_55980 (plasmid) [Pseudomonas guariconensis]